MAIYYPFPEDFILFLQEHLPANVLYSNSTKCFAVKPLMEEFKFMLEMSNAPFLAEEEDPEEFHQKNGMDNFCDVCDAWKLFLGDKIKKESLERSILEYNNRERLEFEKPIILSSLKTRR